MKRIGTLRQSPHLLATLALAAIAILGGFEGQKIIHFALEPDCPGQTAEDPGVCVFCSAAKYFAAEESPELVVPPPTPRATALCEASAASLVDRTRIEYPGRSPPSAS